MGVFRSYYLSCKHDDFADPDANQVESDSIVSVHSANDNTPTRASCWRAVALYLIHLTARRGGFISTLRPY